MSIVYVLRYLHSKSAYMPKTRPTNCPMPRPQSALNLQCESLRNTVPTSIAAAESGDPNANQRLILQALPGLALVPTEDTPLAAQQTR